MNDIEIRNIAKILIEEAKKNKDLALLEQLDCWLAGLNKEIPKQFYSSLRGKI